MKILIIDGWEVLGNTDHRLAGCTTQTQVFETLVNQIAPDAITTTVNTHRPNATTNLDLHLFDAAIWTGGGGNIYADTEFNRDQLKLCEQVLADVPYLWGSCWGLQVVVTVFGGVVAKARVPEIGIASNIVVKGSDQAQRLFHTKPSTFDAPAHHGDEVTRLPSTFEVLAENNVTLQAVAANDGKIACTQYHPELPYDYIRKLLEFWKPNYRNLFSEQEFQALLNALTLKEAAEKTQRSIEFENWLGMV